MAILWCGGEDVDIKEEVWLRAYSGADYGWTSTFSRCSLRGGFASGQNNVVGKGTLFTPVSEFWLHLYGMRAHGGTNYPCWGLKNSNSTSAICIGNQTDDDKLAVRKINSSNVDTLVGEESGISFTYGNNYRFDLYVSGFGTSDGVVKLYKNGVLYIDLTSVDLTVGGDTTVDQFAVYTSQTGGAYTYCSQIIVADEDTRLMNLKTLVPDGAGDTNDWTGAYTDIDEITKSDIDKIYTVTKGDDFQANLTGMPAGGWKVKAVKTVARATDSQAALGLKVGVKTNAAVHLSDAHTLGAGFAVLEKMYLDNPETATPFTSGEIDALQLAYRCDSTTTTTSTSSSTTTTS